MQQLSMHAAAFISWTNDLYSRHKEGDSPLNDTNLMWLLTPAGQPDNAALREAERICQEELTPTCVWKPRLPRTPIRP